jgi:hypothetical protein
VFKTISANDWDDLSIRIGRDVSEAADACSAAMTLGGSPRLDACSGVARDVRRMAKNLSTTEASSIVRSVEASNRRTAAARPGASPRQAHFATGRVRPSSANARKLCQRPHPPQPGWARTCTRAASTYGSGGDGFGAPLLVDPEGFASGGVVIRAHAALRRSVRSDIVPTLVLYGTL